MSKHFPTKAVGLYTVLIFNINYRKLHNELVEYISISMLLYMLRHITTKWSRGKSLDYCTFCYKFFVRFNIVEYIREISFEPYCE